MAWVFVVLAAVAGAALLWTLIDPGGQWRVLVGWAVRDPAAAEPGDAVHGIRRVVAALGLVGVLTVSGGVVLGELTSQPRPPLRETAYEAMWGAPAPRLLDRVIRTQSDAPEGLVPGTVVAVQAISPGSPPHYLLTAPRWSMLGDPAPAGILGGSAPDDATGYGSASLLLSVRGPLMCVPRAVVVQETETEVLVGVWFGLPDDPDGAALDHVEGCAGVPEVEERLLIPVPLAAELDERDVFTLEGSQIRIIPEAD